MKNTDPYNGFEQGPIRPPSEAGSLLIRVTRNCPWNRCTFCTVYKGSRFSLRPVDHVLKDIELIKSYTDRMQAESPSGLISPGRFRELLGAEADFLAVHAAHNFVANGMKSIFLQDGNSLIINPEQLLQILNKLQKVFPTVERITSYARSKTIAKIKDEDLAKFRKAGLNRIHVGMESGANRILTMVNKGVDKQTQILAGQKIKRAGMELSEYWMPGLGGLELSRENALETADALNRINPDFIRLRTLALPGGVPLSHRNLDKSFEKPGETNTVREILLMLDSLEGITSTVRSDHILNLLPEVDGTLPGEKDKITAPIKNYLSLTPDEQVLYVVGRRTQRINRISDLENPQLCSYALNMVQNLGATPLNIDKIVNSILEKFV